MEKHWLIIVDQTYDPSSPSNSPWSGMMKISFILSLYLFWEELRDTEEIEKYAYRLKLVPSTEFCRANVISDILDSSKIKIYQFGQSSIATKEGMASQREPRPCLNYSISFTQRGNFLKPGTSNLVGSIAFSISFSDKKIRNCSMSALRYVFPRHSSISHK
jgi:hypothetical protein